MARQGIALAGGIVGAYFGGPIGAQIGFALGSAIGGYVDPIKVQGPRIGEIPVQTGRTGVGIPFGWGIIHTTGNICGKNPPEIVEVEESVGGKGGGGTVTVSEEIYRSFAIGFCEGPAKGLLRLWENDKLVVDLNDEPAIPYADSQAYLEFLTIYLGDEEQLPDPELESYHGVGTTPAHRGYFYIMWNRYNLTPFGGSIPQFRAEIQIQGATEVTSKPYPLEAIDETKVTVSIVGGGLYELPNDKIEGSVTPLDLEMRQILKSSGPFVDDVQGSVTPLDLEMRQILRSTGPFVDDVQGSVTPISLTMESKLVSTEVNPDKVQTTVSISGGSMTLI